MNQALQIKYKLHTRYQWATSFMLQPLLRQSLGAALGREERGSRVKCLPWPWQRSPMNGSERKTCINVHKSPGAHQSILLTIFREKREIFHVTFSDRVGCYCKCITLYFLISTALQSEASLPLGDLFGYCVMCNRYSNTNSEFLYKTLKHTTGNLTAKFNKSGFPLFVIAYAKMKLREPPAIAAWVLRW